MHLHRVDDDCALLLRAAGRAHAAHLVLRDPFFWERLPNASSSPSSGAAPLSHTEGRMSLNSQYPSLRIGEPLSQATHTESRPARPARARVVVLMYSLHVTRLVLPLEVLRESRHSARDVAKEALCSPRGLRRFLHRHQNLQRSTKRSQDRLRP